MSSTSSLTRTKQLAVRLMILGVILFIPVVVSAQGSHIFDDSGTGAIITKFTGLGSDDPTEVAMSIANSVLGFVSILIFALIAYAGIIWMLARGEAKEVQRAQNIIKAAVVGLFMVMAAWSITLLITNVVNKASTGQPASTSGGSTDKDGNPSSGGNSGGDKDNPSGNETDKDGNQESDGKDG